VRVEGEPIPEADVERVVRIVEIICNHCSSHQTYGELFRIFKKGLIEWIRRPPEGEAELRDTLILRCLAELKEE